MTAIIAQKKSAGRNEDKGKVLKTVIVRGILVFVIRDLGEKCRVRDRETP
jgi:hypothetical protein